MGEQMDLDDDSSSDILETPGEMELDGSIESVSKFQKESRLLQYLPYYAELELETAEYLDKLLINITKSILCRDFQIGLIVYTKSLRTYLYLYGRKFTKDQHVQLIKLYMELLTMETCPLNIIADIADLLNVLLKKPELITREDLTIPWRPLYETINRCCFHRTYTLSFTASAKLENLIKETIRLSNVYFEKNTFPEVVAEFKPFLCPTSQKMIHGLSMLKCFLPFLDPDVEQDVNEFVRLLLSYCDTWNNHPSWEWSMISLVCTATWNMPGLFDWSEYLPKMYARLMKGLELPVYFKGGKNPPGASSAKAFEFGTAARWIVSTLGNDPKALNYLKNFLKSVETYYNPSNHGRWTMPLGALLNELVGTFFLRVKKERFMDNKKRWWYRIADDKKLTDEDIDTFVEITSHLVLEFYLDLNICGLSLKNLALIRPKMIVPAVMEKYLIMVETVTEPRKFMITMRWVTVVLLPMLYSRKKEDGYDGRNLVMPFALSLLPAIDPNDMYKNLSALGCLHGIFNLVPFVDCSSLASTLEDEEERELCLSTGCMEDFVIQFFDRIFSLVENRTHENTRMSDNRAQSVGANLEDVSLEKFLWAVFHRLAGQSSTQICKTAVNKVISHALGSTLETDVSGKLFASILQAYAVARPDLVLPKLLPRICSSVKSMISDDILDDEDLDKTLLFQLLLLSYVMETSGTELLKYKNEVESMLESVFKLNGKKAYGFAAQIIQRLIQSLTYIYPTESRVSEANYDDPNYMAINDWGITMQSREINTVWHVPNQEELDWAKELYIKVFLQFSTPFENIASLTEGDAELNKKLLKNLVMLQAVNDGVATISSFWDNEPIKTTETVVDLSPDRFSFGMPKVELRLPKTNENAMKKYFEVLSNVHTYLEKFKSDDVDAFIAVLRGLDSLIIPVVESERRLLAAVKNGNSSGTQNAIDPKKKWRSGMIVRVYDLHLKRARTAGCTTWTQSHNRVMEKIFELCVNRYAKVRVNAQTRFYRVIDCFVGLISRTVTNMFLEKLQEGIPHHEYKGVLYTMQGAKVSPLIHNCWREIKKLWTALVNSPFSEKNSVIKIMEKIQTSITQNFIYYPLVHRVPVNSKIDSLAKTIVSEKEVENLGPLTKLDTHENEAHFKELIEELIASGSNSNNHWRKQVMCADMLSVLIIQEVPVSHKLVEYFYEGLISHSIEIRRVALITVAWLLFLFKREYNIVEVTEKNIEFAEGESFHSILQYKPKESAPTGYTLKDLVVQNGITPALYVHKLCYGFAAMPQTLKLKVAPKDYSDTTNQKAGQRAVIETTDKFFRNEQYIQKLLDLWSLEEKRKGQVSKRASLAKLIARNNGPEGVKLLIQLALPLGKDKDQWKQKCGANVLCGVLNGLKLWDDAVIAEFWKDLQPHFNECLDNVTQETMAFWSASLEHPTGQRDPNKMRFFIEFLSDRFVKSLETAQTTSVDAFKDMTFYDTALVNAQWRGKEPYFAILNLFKKYFFDTPIPYRNIRVLIGRLLGAVFEWDIDSPVKLSVEICPKYETFIDFLFENLVNLETETVKYQANQKDTEENAEARKLILRFKSVIEWIMAVCWEVESSLNPALYRFIPRLCHFESYDADPELANLSCSALSGLARTLVNPKHVDVLLNTLCECASSTSWRARLCVLEFLKVFALNNLSVLASKEEWANQVVTLVLNLLKDRQLEVREGASKILCGFLHCLLVPKPMELLKSFKKTATKSAKRHREAIKNKSKFLTTEELDEMHSAILGLCAYVDTYPYDVPEFLPDILVVLTTHLNDPQPIPATLRKCLSNFRRTHHDNWSSHKTKFSEDQLCILTDIFVSPCYYA